MPVLCASPSAPHTRTTRSNGAHPAAWHCLGFTGVMCALLGCATTPSSARSAESERGQHGVAAREAPLLVMAPASKASASLTSAQLGAGDAAGAELPWLSPSHIGAAVREHQGDFQACQALGDLMSRREDGSVTVGWAVRANGTTQQVTVGHSSFASPSINACILEVAQQVTFPASAAPTHVSWTVKFRGAAHEPMADATPR